MLHTINVCQFKLGISYLVFQVPGNSHSFQMAMFYHRGKIQEEMHFICLLILYLTKIIKCIKTIYLPIKNITWHTNHTAGPPIPYHPWSNYQKMIYIYQSYIFQLSTLVNKAYQVSKQTSMPSIWSTSYYQDWLYIVALTGDTRFNKSKYNCALLW